MQPGIISHGVLSLRSNAMVGVEWRSEKAPHFHKTRTFFAAFGFTKKKRDSEFRPNPQFEFAQDVFEECLFNTTSSKGVRLGVESAHIGLVTRF